ncbi:MAG: HDOD domain-containing protein [Deltaproteobacteria bacterium]|jgi:putative nucleotidyltransferase with HDIG domain|nr:HDOD domain-containing protein [Deltaproteobacteria bacterium]
MEKDDVLKKIYSKIDEIPTLPAVVPKLLGVMERGGANASDIAGTISTDPALSSKILKVANSAYYGFSQEILSLKLAMPLLGRNMVKSLALSIGVIQSLPSHKKSPNFSDKGLWVHGLAVATLMQELGKRFNNGGNTEHFFITGLLHDIGKVVLNQYFNEFFQEALAEVHNEGIAGLHNAESRLIGFDHGEIGAILLTRWKFPDVISDSIAAHHQTKTPEGTNRRDVAMLRVANALPQELRLGQEGNPVPPTITRQDLKALEIGENEIEEMRAYLAGVEDEIYALFDAMA